MARHRRLVIVLWLLALAASGAAYPWLQHRLGAPAYGVTGSQSASVDAMLSRYFSGRGTEQDVLVFDTAGGPLTAPAARRDIARITAAVARMDGVAAVVGPFGPGARAQVSRDGRAALALVGLDGSSAAQRAAQAARVQGRVAELVRTDPAGADRAGQVRAWLAGYSPTANDLTAVEGADAERAESIGLPVALVVLVLAFGAVVAALVPLLLAMAGLLLSFGVVALLSLGLRVDAFLVTIVTMIGTGIGIDYALFVVSRFREELARRGVPAAGRARGGPVGRADAAADAVAEAVGASLAASGRTVVVSGTIVAISMCSIFVMDSPVFREISIGVVAVVACTLAAALTLLPALLAALGSRVNRGALPARLQPAELRGTKPRGGWFSWAHTVMRRPVLFGSVAAAVLVIVALPLGDLRYGIDLGTASLGSTPSAHAQHVLDRSFGPGVVAPVEVVVTGHGQRPLDEAGLQAARRFGTLIGRQPEVANVGVVSSRGRVLIDAVPAVPIDSAAATALVHRIRTQLVRTAGSGVVVSVGGASAQFADLGAETRHKMPWVLAIVIGLSLVFLLVGFRSLVLPLKAVALNLLCTAAAIGLTIAVFQWGYGAHLLHFDSVGFVQVYLPITVFVMLFGLSMDYEVFLVRRMQESWRRTHDNSVAVATGIAQTARPIAAAAAIMVAVFGSFVTCSVLELKEFGLALAAAVALDATLVRLVLVPAFMRLLGDWNWWLPGTAHRSPGTAGQPAGQPDDASQTGSPAVPAGGGRP
jgi:RND superfamily putative drug exporter